jgi:hypothetical protein
VLSGLAAPVSAVKYEAEDANLLGSALIYASPTASEGEFVGHFNDFFSGVWFNNMPATTTFTLQYASVFSGTMSIYVNFLISVGFFFNKNV